MSFTKKSEKKSSKVDYKARLEHKLYLASMSPSHTYDISECNLENVPSSTYKLCEVFRKEALLMHCNRLKSICGGGALKSLSLITHLDLHSNDLDNLPSEIVNLISLKELYVQENNIQKLPDEIVNLKQLSILNVSKNKLKCLPDAMGEFRNLNILDISHNKALKKLPKSLGQAQQITQIQLEGLNLSYPPEDIQIGGTIVIIAFLANECGIEYTPENYISETETTNEFFLQKAQALAFDKDNEIQATLMKLEKLKEQRQNALLEVEQNIKQQKKQELEMQDKLKFNKLKLLDGLAQQQIQTDKEVEKVQQERDLNRSRLLSHIHNAEKEADNVIKEFLHTTEKERQIQAQLLELEKKEYLQILSKSHSEQSLYRTKDTLLAMEELLKEELSKEKKLADYTAFRDCNAQSLLSLEVKNNEQLLQIMQNQEKSRQDLIIKLRDDEQLQKAVVAALLERSDARSWSIVQQVNLVQSQLAALTNIELEKKNLEINQKINDVADKRTTLSAILVSLLTQKEERRQELLETVKRIEEQKCISDLSKKDSLFWLLQYQNLTEARPKGLLETLDPNLVRHVAAAGALHCLPFLSSLSSLISELDHDHLISMGIKSEGDRVAIMLAVESYLAEKKLSSLESHSPSAPPLEEEPCTSSCDPQFKFLPSAPTECIVCMDLDCEIIFLPCGHLCCCATCTEMLSVECPMCRTTIERKIRISLQ